MKTAASTNSFSQDSRMIASVASIKRMASVLPGAQTLANSWACLSKFLYHTQ